MTEHRNSVLDWDNTLHRGFTVLGWLKFLGTRMPDLSEVVSDASVTVLHWKGGRISYEAMATRVVRAYWGAVSHIPPDDLRLLASDFVAAGLDMMPFARDLLRALKRLGSTTIISGAPKAVLESAVISYALPVTEVVGLPDFPTSFRDSLNVALPDVKAAIVAKQQDLLFAVGDSVADLPLFIAAQVCMVVDNPILAERLLKEYNAQVITVAGTDTGEKVASLIDRAIEGISK